MVYVFSLLPAFLETVLPCISGNCVSFPNVNAVISSFVFLLLPFYCFSGIVGKGETRCMCVFKLPFNLHLANISLGQVPQARPGCGDFSAASSSTPSFPPCRLPFNPLLSSRLHHSLPSPSPPAAWGPGDTPGSSQGLGQALQPSYRPHPTSIPGPEPLLSTQRGLLCAPPEQTTGFSLTLGWPVV